MDCNIINKCIIFSKNRAAQLDALLRSMQDFNWMKNYRTTVLGSYEGDLNPDAWAMIQAKWKEVEFIDEIPNSFESHVRLLLDDYADNVMFVVDDGIFLERCIPITYHIPNGGCCAYRLGYDMIQRHEFSGDHFHWYFNCQMMEDQYPEWRQPFSLDAHVYNLVDIRACLDNISFNDPKSLRRAINDFHKTNKIIASCQCFRHPLFANFSISRPHDSEVGVSDVRLTELFVHGYELYYPYRPLITSTRIFTDFVLMKSDHKSIVIDL